MLPVDRRGLAKLTTPAPWIDPVRSSLEAETREGSRAAIEVELKLRAGSRAEKVVDGIIVGPVGEEKASKEMAVGEAAATAAAATLAARGCWSNEVCFLVASELSARSA